jgi:hypothetical protein
VGDDSWLTMNIGRRQDSEQRWGLFCIQAECAFHLRKGRC